MIDGDEHTQMIRLYDYRLELIRTHLGSTIKFECNRGVFQFMYVCLSPLRAGFHAGCSPIIFLTNDKDTFDYQDPKKKRCYA